MIISGIEALIMGDGAGAKQALALMKSRFLRIFSYNRLSYMSAQSMTPDTVTTGTLYYNVPYIAQTQAMNASGGTGPFDNTQVGTILVNIDKFRMVKLIWRTVDIIRMGDFASIINQVTGSVTQSAMVDLNAQFLKMLMASIPKERMIALPDLADDEPLDQPKLFKLLNCWYSINKKIADLSKIFDKHTLGVNPEEFVNIYDPRADVAFRATWTNSLKQSNLLFNKSLQGYQLGNFNYFVDPMLNNSIPVNTSFSKDEAFDSSNYIGFIFHREAISFPFRIISLQFLVDNDTGDPKLILKMVWGGLLLRPELCWAVVKTIPTTLQFNRMRKDIVNDIQSLPRTEEEAKQYYAELLNKESSQDKELIDSLRKKIELLEQKVEESKEESVEVENELD